jgi:hypothetical protein
MRGQRFIGAPARLPADRRHQVAGGRARLCRPMRRLDINKTPLRAAWDYVALHKREASEAAP